MTGLLYFVFLICIIPAKSDTIDGIKTELEYNWCNSQPPDTNKWTQMEDYYDTYWTTVVWFLLSSVNTILFEIYCISKEKKARARLAERREERENFIRNAVKNRLYSFDSKRAYETEFSDHGPMMSYVLSARFDSRRSLVPIRRHNTVGKSIESIYQTMSSPSKVRTLRNEDFEENGRHSSINLVKPEESEEQETELVYFDGYELKETSSVYSNSSRSHL